MISQRAGPPPEGYASYIRDMLGQLADLAHITGERKLERSIREAAREAAALPDPPHDPN